MPNLASALKEEIRRLARKEIRQQVGSTMKAAAQFRREIAALKRQVQQQARTIAFLENQEKKRLTKGPGEEAPADNTPRFSPKWLKAHRQRLELSAADYGKLVGVTGQTIYKWEQGKAKPRPGQVAALGAVRQMRKREAHRRLELLAG